MTAEGERYFSVVCWGTLVSWLFACGWSHTCTYDWCWLDLLDFFKTLGLEGDGRYIEKKGDLERGSWDEYDRQALYVNLRKECSNCCYMPESESRDAESPGHKITGWWEQRNTNHWGKMSKMTNYWRQAPVKVREGTKDGSSTCELWVRVLTGSLVLG